MYALGIDRDLVGQNFRENGNFWKETYFWHDGMKEELEQKIIDFITYLEQNPELYNAYITKWNWRG